MTLSATFSGLLVLSSVVESMFNVPLEIVKSILLLISVGLIVLAAFTFALEVSISVRALGMSVHHTDNTHG